MYIYEHKEWPEFSWDKELVNSKLKKVYEAVGYLKGRLSMLGFEDRELAVAESISHDVVASSGIEGVDLNREDVRSSVARKLGVPTLDSSASSRYIDGIVDMTLDAVTNYDSPLTKDRLFGWHNCLFPTGWSGLAKIDVAMYRTGAMRVISGMPGREKEHYVAPPADRVDEEMDRFLSWFNSSADDGYLKSAIAHLWFVSIHPFDDGNGRIGRAIADMALSQADNSRMRFFSVSRQISNEKRRYYAILERTQRGDCDITDWISWYLDCLVHAVECSDETLSRVLNKAAFWQNHSETAISERQRDVLNRYLDGAPGKLNIKNWSKHAGVSPDTAARDIHDLVSKDILVPLPGRVRDISYAIRCSDTLQINPGED